MSRCIAGRDRALAVQVLGDWTAGRPRTATAGRPTAGRANLHAAPAPKPTRVACGTRARGCPCKPLAPSAAAHGCVAANAVLRQEHARAGAWPVPRVCARRPPPCGSDGPKLHLSARWRCAATLTSLQPHARCQVCRVSAVTAGLVYGAVKSTYLQTFKARWTARCVDLALPRRGSPTLTPLLSPRPRKRTGTTEQTTGRWLAGARVTSSHVFGKRARKLVTALVPQATACPCPRTQPARLWSPTPSLCVARASATQGTAAPRAAGLLRLCAPVKTPLLVGRGLPPK